MILAVDQGTSSTKASLFDDAGGLVTSASVPVGQSHPHPGWVEQDAALIAQSVRDVISQIADLYDVDAVALSTQRESAVVWDRATGDPVAPMLGWQDRRTASRAAQLTGSADRVRSICGLPLDPMFSALKFEWILDTVDPHRARSRAGELAIGTVDSWLMYQLTGDHRIEAGNASRTQLVDLSDGSWSEELCELFDVPHAVLPRIVPSDEPSDPIADLPGRRVHAVLGDSHAALYGHGVREAGAVKATYGTGSSVMGLARDSSHIPAGLVGTIAWQIGQKMQIAYEGNILASGAALTWVSRLVGRSVAELSAQAREVPADHGVTLVPAVAGLGAPHWDPAARAVIVGFDLGTNAAMLARAAIEAQAHQVADIIDAVSLDHSIDVIRVDGGSAKDDFLMQFQADAAHRVVSRPSITGLSARGAAELAANSLGTRFDTMGADVFTPQTETAVGRTQWAAALARTKE